MPTTQKKITRLNYREDWTPTDHALATLLDVRRLPGDVTPSQLVLGESLDHLPSALRSKIEALHELVRSRIGRVEALSGITQSSADVAKYFRSHIGHDRTESFWTQTLDAKNQVRGTHCIARGERSSCAAHAAYEPLPHPALLAGPSTRDTTGGLR